MGSEPKEIPVPIETAVKEFVRFLPEEKRNDYELMLRRCNFHDDDDPLFPILLFLLFFQESVGENVNRIEASVAGLKASFPQCAKAGNDRWMVPILFFGLIALMIVHLLTFGCGELRRLPRENTLETAAPTPRRELLDIQYYWMRKLAEEPAPRPGSNVKTDKTKDCDEL